jgi:Zn-dependent peptidase ImmA (M78 family)
MPAEEIDFWLPRRSGELERLEEGSKIWGVSMQALLRRAHDLGKVDRPAYQRTMKRMSAMGWRTKEPVDMGPPERPELLARARAALADSGYSLAKVAAEIGIAKKRLAKMLSVPEDRDENPEAEIVAFDSLVRSAS